MKKNILSLLLMYCSPLFGQTFNNIHDATPPTPEAYAVTKYVDIPMDYSSGVPPISIPLYTLKCGNIELPITLNYNASGIKVEEIATWVGLGWNLSTGPTLIRTVQGNPDEAGTGFRNPPYITINDSTFKYSILYHSELAYNSFERNYIEQTVQPTGQIDLGADIYHFNALGYSGKFYWSQQTESFIITPHQNILLEEHSGYIITLPNGIKCHYTVPELLTSAQTKSYNSGTNSWDATYQNSSNTPYATAWHISLIEDPNGNTISFNYNIEFGVKEFGRNGITYKPLAGHTQPYLYTKGYYLNTYNKPVLSSIETSDGDKIIFKLNESDRLDVVNKGKHLNSINIYTNYNSYLKSYVFNYFYKTSSDGAPLDVLTYFPGISGIDNSSRKRLFLNSIQEGNFVSLDTFPKYYFEYINIDLPNRFSTSQDYWGYYNGKNNGEFLIPILPDYPSNIGFPVFLSANKFKRLIYDNIYVSADRRIDTTLTQAGLLKKIIYPTGGYTEYEFQQNDVPASYFKSLALITRPDCFKKSTTFMPIINASLSNHSGEYKHSVNINNPVSWVAYKINYLNNNNSCCNYNYYLRNLADSSIITLYNLQDTLYLELDEGNYEFICHFNDIYSTGEIPEFTINIHWYEVVDSLNMKIGGLRVANITNYDGLGNSISRAYEYKKSSNSNDRVITSTSSGTLSGFPTFRRIKRLYQSDIINSNYSANLNYIDIYDEFSSGSIMPLTGDGTLVRYTNVTEYYDANKSTIKTDYGYSNDFSVFNLGVVNSFEVATKPWMSGKPLYKIIYEKFNNEYRIIKKEYTFYTVYNDTSFITSLDAFQLMPKYGYSNWHLPTSTAEYSYHFDQDGNFIESIINISQTDYNSLKLPSKSISYNSQNDIIESSTYYPTDFISTNYNLPEIKSRYILNNPILQLTKMNDRVMNGSFIKYDSLGNPIEIYKYYNDSLIQWHHDSSLIDLTYFQLVTKAKYDHKGNITHIEKYNEPESSYLLGEFGIPLAICKNAKPEECYYISFESNKQYALDKNAILNGSLVYSYNFTGSSCFELGTINLKGLSSKKKYKVSYWSLNGPFTISNSTKIETGRTEREWTYFEHELEPLTTNINISGSGLIDEIRVLPIDATMITFSYNNRNQIIDKSDENNMTTFYKYDQLRRLIEIRDKDYNILKMYEYQINP